MPSEPPLILAFDTSAAFCAAGLFQGGRLLVAGDEIMPRGQAERLLPMQEHLLAEAGRTWSDIGRIAVCTGPGNFTGIRVAVSAARGLAMTLDIPALGISTFEALASADARPVIVALPERRDTVVYQAWANGAAIGAPVRRLADLPDMPTDTLCVGQNAKNTARELGLSAGSEAVRADLAVMARIAAKRARRPDQRPAPLYLRPADATPSAAPLALLGDDA